MNSLSTLKITSSGLKWISIVLYERFGIPFMVDEKEDRFILRRPSNSKEIIVNKLITEFYAGRSDLPCVSWDGESEGWNTKLGKSIPAPGSSALYYPLIEKQNSGYVIHYDILGLIYWMLNRFEELNRFEVDVHGRFPAYASHAAKNNYLDRPIVDEWLYILAQVIELTWPEINLKRHSFSQKVSHDVDFPVLFGFANYKNLIKRMAVSVIRNKDLKSAMLAPWIRINNKKKLHTQDPYNTFDWIMDVSDRCGIKSAFYFICGRTNEQRDGDYDFECESIRDLIRHIHSRGHEIGLHPSYETYLDEKLIKGEFNQLKKVCSEESIGQSVWGGRMHYLRWQHPVTMQLWNDAGLNYDSTLGYADRPGFRCGTCFEYPAFNPLTNKILNLRIRPLIAMECTVMAKHYMGMGTGDNALEIFIRLKDACRKVNGCFTLLWHNSELDTDEKRNLYQLVVCN